MLFTPKECDVDVGKLDAAAEEMLNLVSRISGMSGDMEDHFNNSARGNRCPDHRLDPRIRR